MYEDRPEIDIIEPVDFDVERRSTAITQKAIENPFSIIDRLNCSKYIILTVTIMKTRSPVFNSIL